MPKRHDALLIRRFGTSEPPAEARRLRAGRLAVDLVDGQLRAICYDGVEIIRGISYVVRDKDWGSYSLDIANLQVEEAEVGFLVHYDASCVDKENSGQTIVFSARIESTDSKNLTYKMSACPDDAFMTARCGFTILHPLNGTVGKLAFVEHGDGRREETLFPDLIEPCQPFKDVRAITHWPENGICVTCRIEGDVFETEDQRAWSDASFKTYVRPLALPWPYVLPAGETFEQSVSLFIQDERTDVGQGHSERLSLTTLTVGAAFGRMPDIGLVVTPETEALEQTLSERFCDIAPRLVLLHYDPAAGHDRDALHRFKAQVDFLAISASFHKRLEFAVPVDEEPQTVMARLHADLDAAGLHIDSLMLCPDVDRQSTPPGSIWPACPPLETIYKAARDAFPGLPIGGGMMSYFPELNRKRPPMEYLDFVAHGTAAVVHAADDLSVMQTLQTLPDITRSARAIIGGSLPYHIAPATIAMRQNPYGDRLIPNPSKHRQPITDRDPRQAGTFAAAWQVGYFAGIARESVDSVTVGIIGTPMSLWNENTVFPVYQTSRVLSHASGAKSYACHADTTGIVAAVAFESGHMLKGEEGHARLHLLVSNLTGEAQTILIDDRKEAKIVMRIGDDGDDFTERRLADGQATLSPYGTVLIRLDE
jgi:D-apionolactonase